jgi:hypothetical protein
MMKRGGEVRAMALAGTREPVLIDVDRGSSHPHIVPSWRRLEGEARLHPDGVTQRKHAKYLHPNDKIRGSRRVCDPLGGSGLGTSCVRGVKYMYKGEK